MIIEKTFYAVVCDNCKQTFNGEYMYFGSEGDAVETSKEADWKTIVEPPFNKHYCPDCWSWDDNDELIINKERFKP